MKKILMIAAIALLAVACNKDQRGVNKLSAEWKSTEIRAEFTAIGGLTTSISLSDKGVTQTITFDKCKLKDDEWCTYTSTSNLDISDTFLGIDQGDNEVETTTGLYRVTGDGENLEQKDEASSTTIVTSEIVDLTRKNLKLKTVVEFFFGGTTYSITINSSYEKQ